MPDPAPHSDRVHDASSEVADPLADGPVRTPPPAVIGRWLADAMDGAAGTLRGPPRDAARIAALAVSGQLTALSRLAQDLDDHCRSRDWMAEICLQCVIYCGPADLPDLLDAIGVDPAARHGPDAPCESVATACTAEAMRTKLHGTRSREDHADPSRPATAALYARVAELGYGAIWTRPGPDMRSRLAAAVAALAVTGPDSLLRKFWHAGRAHGLSADELRDCVTLTAVAQGAPRAFRALQALPEETVRT